MVSSRDDRVSPQPIERDPLTGARSRAGLDAWLVDAIAEAREQGRPLSLGVLDLDYFKSVNDAYGHRRGDRILRELVRRLQAGIRSGDELFRFGGDEFVLLLPGIAAADATAIAARLLGEIEGVPFAGDPPLSLSLSLGVATFPDDAETPAALLDVADRRRFDAKRAGRGRAITGVGVVMPVLASRVDAADPSAGVAAGADLVGREGAIDEILERFERARLLTLTGPAGVGKSSLARHVVALLRGSFEHGVAALSCTHLADPAAVPAALAAVLGITVPAGRTCEKRLAEVLRAREQLLVFDHMDRVRDAAPFLTELLSAAPGLKVLVTSRRPLRLYGEHVYAVPPLAVHGDDQGHRSPAVALFIARAEAVRGTRLSGTEAATAVAALCSRLGGHPLAIELAAASAARFPLEDLVAALGPRSAQDASAGEVLRDVLERVYQQLTPEQRRRWARLAVFTGGWSVEAARAVVEEPPAPPLAVQAALGALAATGLIRPVGDAVGPPRFTMPEAIREEALVRLEASGGAECVRTRHAAWCLALAEEAAAGLRGVEHKRWLDRLEEEYDNLRSALNHSLACGDIETAARLGAALWRFWERRGWAPEGRAWLTAILDRAGDLPPEVEAEVLNGAGVLAWFQGDLVEARERLEASLAISSRRGDTAAMARDLNNLGLVLRQQGEYPAAEEYLTRGLALQRLRGDGWGQSLVLGNLAELAILRGDRSAARRWAAECLAIARALSEQRLLALALCTSGVVALDQGDLERARAVLAECLALAESLADPRTTARSLTGLGLVALLQGRHESAANRFGPALDLWYQIGDRPGLAEVLGGLAGVVGAAGAPLTAARLFGAASVVGRSSRGAAPLVLRAALGEVERRIRSGVDAATWSAAWGEGQAMPLEHAVALARDAVAGRIPGAA